MEYLGDYVGALTSGLFNILPFSDHGTDAFTALLIGVAIGFVVGILPGLGGAVALALMLPFTFSMDPTSAFAFLLGANAVTATTGDITSVLFGVPGEGISAAVIVDGHPMAKNGEAGRALGAALMSSLVGAIFGALFLALAIPIVRPLVLSIASPEFFMLALLGITFVASLSGESMIKGLAVGGIGLTLAMVGLDPIEGIPRYTLEPVIGISRSLFLWDGINIVSVTVGLFAIPEIIDLAVKGTGISERSGEKLGGVMQGVKDTFTHWKLVFRCSALGAYIGLIPGLGGGPAQWMAYAHAVQSSPGGGFGKGRVEGVLGPGAANNSKEGGSLIPTLAFGVPGSVSMAILLGAFIIQGLVPGPAMLDPNTPVRPDAASLGGFNPSGLELTFSFVWILIVSNIITVVVAFLFLGQLAKITQMRGALLIPFILLLVFLGGFAVKNAPEDVAMVIVFGLLGWVMVRYDWPRPPILLGLVLGGIAESNLFIATQAYGTLGWITRPGVIFLGLVMVGSVAYAIRRDMKRRSAAAAELSDVRDVSDTA
ncbi:MAG: tripartite tricarboxylate transporter permease [Chloroflexi bacterium]|nr:tripartite tricarboxylate transporter permease [Chloroflexota bacterium]MCI0888007.1 tripartite tricarboxylate transporter permease [Chloroflexota bacterium]